MLCGVKKLGGHVFHRVCIDVWLGSREKCLRRRAVRRLEVDGRCGKGVGGLVEGWWKGWWKGFVEGW